MIHHLTESVLAVGAAYHSRAHPAPGPKDEARHELEKFRGSWRLVYWLVNGQERSYGKIIMSFDAERFRIEIDGTLTEEGTLKGLDPTQSPKGFDYAPHML